MPWAKLDDHFHDNPKVRRAWRSSNAAVGLHVMALTYSAAHLLDGRVEPEFVADQMPAVRQQEAAAQALIDAGLWLPTKDGWEIKDYLAYNPSRADVEAKRAARAAAGRAGGLASGVSRRGEANA